MPWVGIVLYGPMGIVRFCGTIESFKADAETLATARLGAI